MDDIYTPETLAERWKCSAKHVRDLIKEGELAAFRLGGMLLRIRAQTVEEYECRNGASPDCAEGSRSRSSKTESAAGIHSELMTRARLTNLRQRITQS